MKLFATSKKKKIFDNIIIVSQVQLNLNLVEQSNPSDIRTCIVIFWYERHVDTPSVS